MNSIKFYKWQYVVYKYHSIILSKAEAIQISSELGSTQCLRSWRNLVNKIVILIKQNQEEAWLEWVELDITAA